MPTIKVVANPFIALDKDGVPQGTVCLPGSPTSHIGAHLDLTLSQRLGVDRFYFPLGYESGEDGKPIRGSDGRKKPGKGVFTIPLSGDIAAAVRAGELLAADAESARLCGIDQKDFLEPDAALEKEREKALKYFGATKGLSPKDAKFAELKLGDIPREPAEREPEDDMTPRARAQITPTLKVETGAAAPASSNMES